MIAVARQQVLCQGYFGEFSVTVALHNKAQLAGNGLVLVKSCNAVVERDSNARRVALSAPKTALRLLQRTKAICCDTCLVMDADRATESVKITLAEY